MRTRLLLALCLVFSFLHPAAQTAQPAAAQSADEIVANYRRIIVLMEDDPSLDAGQKQRIATLGRMLFEQNMEHLAALRGEISADPARLSAFLDRLEKNSAYHDADKLAFRELLDDLAAEPPKGASPDVKKRIAEDIVALDSIQALYQKELSHVFDRIRTRGMSVRREAWESYLAAIKKEYQRDAILKEFEALLPVDDTRGAGARRKRDPNVLDGTELPPKTLLLTFDDGPHARYTDAILAVLKKYNLQAVFFEVGHNIGTVDADGAVKLGPGAAASARILQAGSALGNHSYTHPLLPKMDPAGYTREIDNTNSLLKAVLKGNPVLFRPPYGAQNAGILGLVESNNEKSMIWNIDSMDWADPVANSVAQRVLKQVEQQGRGVILFHDIHRRALDALPGLIETLQAQGYRFASWNGNGFSVNDARGVQTVALPKTTEPPYRESWAAVIGIDDYQKWPKLRYAANDANGVRDILVQKYRFKPENVFVLLNGQATRQNILSLLGDKLANPDMVKREDRVFVFYAGHGATRKLPSGRDLGYIIPVDADMNSYEGQAISMTNFQDIAEAIPAKHLLFVMDSCYSGLALTRGAGLGMSSNYFQEIARRAARQMFTAGGSDEQVADNGPNGHSIFTWTVLQGLDGRADLNGDGVITATELAAYAAPTVSSLSRQTPAFGNLAGSEGGDFIFELRHESEFLSADSRQLNDDGIRMNGEMEKLRAQNENLQKQLAEAHARLEQKAQAGGPVLTPRETSQVLNDQGMRLYKEKKYSEAVAKFNEAAAADPTNPQAVNNAGFTLYKMEKYEESVKLFLQTLKLDPNRAVAYINLGDAYVKLQKTSEARAAYEKYLELAPNSKSAPDVREKLKALNP